MSDPNDDLPDRLLEGVVGPFLKTHKNTPPIRLSLSLSLSLSLFLSPSLVHLLHRKEHRS